MEATAMSNNANPSQFKMQQPKTPVQLLGLCFEETLERPRGTRFVTRFVLRGNQDEYKENKSKKIDYDG